MSCISSQEYGIPRMRRILGGLIYGPVGNTLVCPWNSYTAILDVGHWNCRINGHSFAAILPCSNAYAFKTHDVTLTHATFILSFDYSNPPSLCNTVTSFGNPRYQNQ